MATNKDSQLVIVTDADIASDIDIRCALAFVPEAEWLTHDEMMELAIFRNAAAANELERQAEKEGQR